MEFCNDVLFKRLNRLLYLTIIVFVLGDVLRKLSIFFVFDFTRYTAIAKSTVLLCYVLTIAFNGYYLHNTTTRKLIYLTLGLVLVYICGQLILIDSAPIFQYSNNILILHRYLFWPLTFIVFLPLITNANFDNKQFKLFEIIFLVNAVVILASFLLDIKIFQTYYGSDRFGFMGFYGTHNQTSYYFIIMILFYYYLHQFKNADWKKLVFVLLVSLLIGTKKIYFFLMILALYHFIIFKVWKNKYFYIKVAAALIVCLTFFESIKEIIHEKFKIFFTVYHESGFLSMLTSYRNEILVSTINETILKSWRFLNYILGGPKFYEFRSEFGFIDLYFFFGFFGLYVFFKLFELMFNLTDKNQFFLFIIVALMIVAFFAEGFFSSANQPLAFVLISGFFIIESKRLIKMQNE